MGRERLSNADTVMLRAEDPANPNSAVGVMVFGSPIDYEDLLATFESRILRIGRFRQHVVQPLVPWARPYWEDDPDFDLRYHVQRAVLPAPSDEGALLETVSLLAGLPLDFRRPLWQVFLVENYDPGPQAHSRQGSVLISRLHHSLGDGLALMQVMLSLADGSSRGPQEGGEPEPAADPRHSHRPRSGAARRTARELGLRNLDTLEEPTEREERLRLARAVVGTAGRLLLMPPDPSTVLKGEPAIPKRVAWSEPFTVEEVKGIGRRIGGTINDVLLTAVTGALGRYLLERGELTAGQDIRATVPISLRQPDAVGELGNEIGIVFLALPVGISDPMERMRELKRRMDRLKGSVEAPLFYHAMQTFGSVPTPIVHAALGLLGSKATAVVTNVIGPRERLDLAGAPLEALMFWTPRFGGVGVGVSILSYAGEVRVGVITDADHVPDPEAIVAALQAEMAALQSEEESLAHPPSLAELSERLDKTLASLDGLLDTGARESSKSTGV